MNKKELINFVGNFSKILQEIPKLRLLGDSALHTPAQITHSKEIPGIAHKLKNTLLAYRKITGLGRGIAAPQIGIPKRVFITYVNDEFQVYANPEITEKSKQQNCFRELCMSVSLISAKVKRPEWIVMKWQDESGKWHQEKFDGFMARLLQHEYAHLEGRVNLDEKATLERRFVDFDPAKENLENC